MIFIAMALTAADPFDDGRVLPLANGEWTYVRDDSGSSARFDAQFAARCDRASHRIALSRFLPGPAAGQSMMIDTDTGTLTFSGPVGVLNADDDRLDAIVFSRGRFIVRVGGGSVAIPAEPELARAVEDCRN